MPLGQAPISTILSAASVLISASSAVMALIAFRRTVRYQRADYAARLRLDIEASGWDYAPADGDECESIALRGKVALRNVGQKPVLLSEILLNVHIHDSRDWLARLTGFRPSAPSCRRFRRSTNALAAGETLDLKFDVNWAFLLQHSWKNRNFPIDCRLMVNYESVDGSPGTSIEEFAHARMSPLDPDCWMITVVGEPAESLTLVGPVSLDVQTLELLDP